MNLSHLLIPSSVRLAGTITSKKRLFQDLGDVAASAYDLDFDMTVNALLERESLGPTGVGHGVALPHARIEGLQHVCGAFVRLEKPLDYDSVDRQPVDLVFALFAPVDAGVEHLKALALVSRTMRNSGVCSKLRANSEPLTLHAILTEVPATQAA
jgi:PTS system nitrogen regulatory IIA component